MESLEEMRMLSLIPSFWRTRSGSIAPARSDPLSPTQGVDLRGEQPRLLGPTPREHARHVAHLFLDRVHAEGHSLELTTDAVVILVRSFARAANVQVPADRTVLTQIKRLPGVRVEQDRRVFNGHQDAVQHKTTVYILPRPDSSEPRWPTYRVVAGRANVGP